MPYKPYRTGGSNNYYKKSDKRSKGKNPSPNYYEEETVKLFGFRSGKAYKIIPAFFYYIAAAIYIGWGIYGEIAHFEFEAYDVILTVMKYVFWFVLFYSPAIFLSDFGYRDSLPFFKKHETGSSIIGMILVCMICYLMAELDIYCMSQTYKDSMAAYEASYEEDEDGDEEGDAGGEDDEGDAVSGDEARNIRGGKEVYLGYISETLEERDIAVERVRL